MAKPKQKEKIVHPLGEASKADWSKSNATYLAGRAAMDGTDELAAQMEIKWGVGRLRLLVPEDLRLKFDRQRYLYNQAIWHGDLEAVRRESVRMATAWRALDKAATGADQSVADPGFSEIQLDDGTVAFIARGEYPGRPQNVEGRKAAVYTLEEIGRLLSAYPEIAKAKEVFPGAEVVSIRRTAPRDPLDAIADTGEPLDEIPF